MQHLLQSILAFYSSFAAPPPTWSPFRDIAKFITQFVVEEIDENTSLEDLQKMMAVALVYRVLVCIYEVRLTSSTAPEVAAP